jgi:hypothetical protein
MCLLRSVSMGTSMLPPPPTRGPTPCCRMVNSPSHRDLAPMRKHVEAVRRLGHGLKNRIAREEQRTELRWEQATNNRGLKNHMAWRRSKPVEGGREGSYRCCGPFVAGRAMETEAVSLRGSCRRQILEFNPVMISATQKPIEISRKSNDFHFNKFCRLCCFDFF